MRKVYGHALSPCRGIVDQAGRIQAPGIPPISDDPSNAISKSGMAKIVGQGRRLKTIQCSSSRCTHRSEPLPGDPAGNPPMPPLWSLLRAIFKHFVITICSKLDQTGLARSTTFLRTISPLAAVQAPSFTLQKIPPVDLPSNVGPARLPDIYPDPAV